MYVTDLLTVDIQVASSFHHWNNTAVNIPVHLSSPIIFLTAFLFNYLLFFYMLPPVWKKKSLSIGYSPPPAFALSRKRLPVWFTVGNLTVHPSSCLSLMMREARMPGNSVTNLRGGWCSLMCFPPERFQWHLEEGTIRYQIPSVHMLAWHAGGNSPLKALLSFVKSTLRVRSYWTSSVVSEL